MNWELERHLRALRGQRDRLATDLRRVDEQIGQVAGQLVELPGQSRSAVARLLGVSHTYVAALIERAAKASPPSTQDEQWLTPVLHGDAALTYLQQTRRSVVTVIAAFSAGDALLASGLHPQAFEQGQNYSLYVPNMLCQLDDGSWLGVDNAVPGYGGTGGTNLVRFLEDLGLPAALVSSIADYRYSRADVTSGQVDGTNVWPRYPAGEFTPIEGAYVVDLGSTALASGDPRVDESGFYSSWDGRSALETWLDYLDGPECPEWMRGDRVARVFLNEDAARQQGFVHSRAPLGVGRRARACPLIIEQGQLQLWLPLLPTRDSTQMLSPELYQALTEAGLYPTELASRDDRSRFWRYLDARLRPDARPNWIDISTQGDLHLRAVPRPPATTDAESLPTGAVPLPQR